MKILKTLLKIIAGFIGFLIIIIILFAIFSDDKPFYQLTTEEKTEECRSEIAKYLEANNSDPLIAGYEQIIKLDLMGSPDTSHVFRVNRVFEEEQKQSRVEFKYGLLANYKEYFKQDKKLGYPEAFLLSINLDSLGKPMNHKVNITFNKEGKFRSLPGDSVQWLLSFIDDKKVDILKELQKEKIIIDAKKKEMQAFKASLEDDAMTLEVLLQRAVKNQFKFPEEVELDPSVILHYAKIADVKKGLYFANGQCLAKNAFGVKSKHYWEITFDRNSIKDIQVNGM